MLDIANNTLYRRRVHFSPPNRQSGQQRGTFLLHPKSSPQSQVETVVLGLIPKPAAEEAGGYETALSRSTAVPRPVRELWLLPGSRAKTWSPPNSFGKEF